MFKGLIPSSALGTWDPGAQHCCLLNSWLLRETRMPLFPVDTRYSEQKQKPGTILSILLSSRTMSFPIFIFLYVIIQTLKCFYMWSYGHSTTFAAQTTYVKTKMSLNFLSFSKSLAWLLCCNKTGIADIEKRAAKIKSKGYNKARNNELNRKYMILTFI